MNESEHRSILRELEDDFLEGDYGDGDSVESGLDEIPAIDGFEHLEFVGAGGMGAVYSGVQKKLDRRVAIKILWPNWGGRISTSLMRRFDEECKLLAKLDHPNIVRVLHAGECTLEGGRVRPFFAMDFVEGADLRSLLEQGWPTIDTTVSIMKQLCEGLMYAHAQGIIHRDIKPENILLDASGTLRIVDFGIGRNQNRTHRMTTRGQSPGTPGYIAPEILNGGQSDERCDVYATGVVFYEMLTGEIPFRDYKPASDFRSELNAAWDSVVERAVAISRDSRFAKMSDLADAIDSLPPVIEVKRESEVTQSVEELGELYTSTSILPEPLLDRVNRKLSWMCYQGFRWTTFVIGVSVTVLIICFGAVLSIATGSLYGFAVGMFVTLLGATPIGIISWAIAPFQSQILSIWPRKDSSKQLLDDYEYADDALATAYTLDHCGEWDAAITLYESVDKRWPEQHEYITACIASIKEKKAMSNEAT